MAADPKIAINVVTEFVPEQSDPARNQFLFHYHITILNQSEQTVTLTRRHWLIHDSNGKQLEVEGAGVVGETPTLEPMQQHSYSSAVVLETPVGSMHGNYTFEGEHGPFKAPIAPFQLCQPGILH